MKTMKSKKENFRRLKAIPLLVLALIMAVSTAACGNSDSADDVQNSGDAGSTLTIGFAGSLSSLDVNQEAGILNYYVAALTQEGLVGLDNDGKTVPGLAESYEDEDLTVWKFKLRKDVKFQNGEPVTAEDIVYSIERARSAEQSPGIVYYWPTYVEKVEATAEDEITITLDGPHATFIWAVSSAGGLLVTPKAWSEAAGTIGSPTDLIVGSGPYKAVEFIPDSHVTLERSDTWWNGTPKFDKIIINFYKDENARQLAFAQGDIDFALNIPVDQETQWTAGGSTVEYIADRSYYGLTFDPTVAPFDDEHVRKAVAYAVDKESIVKGSILDGHGEAATAIPAPEQFASALSLDEARKVLSGVSHYDFDMEQAKAEVAQSKVPQGFETTLTYPDSYPQAGQASLVIADALKKIGITLDVKEIPLDQWLNEVGDGNQGVGWMIYFPTTSEPAEITSWLLAANGPGANPANWTNAEVAALTAEAGVVPAEEQIEPIVKSLNIAQSQAIYQPVWWGQGANALKSGVTADDFTSYTLLSADWASRFSK